MHKTAVTTPFGLFEFTRMPLGLHNAAQTFQRFIDTVLRGLDFCYAYIDDILIASKSPEEHLRHLRLVFERFSEHGVIINPSVSSVYPPWIFLVITLTAMVFLHLQRRYKQSKNFLSLNHSVNYVSSLVW